MRTSTGPTRDVPIIANRPQPSSSVTLDRGAFPRGIVAVAVLLWLGVALLAHPIGDPYSESDFYGGYAAGAREILSGRIDPGRYGIVGPVYESALALLGALGLETFLAARLLSVASAGVALAAWGSIAAAALGTGAARWAVALVALTPAFTRHAYSAGTDMLATGLASAALAALVRGVGPGAAAYAGVIAALAALTRYQALVLLPVALVALGRRRSPVGEAGGSRWQGLAAFALGFAVVAAPWVAFSVSRGHVPGQALVTYYGFYAAEDASRNLQDLPAIPPAAEGDRSLARLLRERPLDLAGRWSERAWQHLDRDARDLIGAGLAVAAGLGGLLWGARRLGRHRGLLAASGVVFHLGLVPAFYSERYRLMLVPLYAVAAAALWPALGSRGRAGKLMAAGLLIAAAAPLAASNVALQARVARELPRDVLQLAPVLAAQPPGAVMARKGHLGYHAGREVVAFPRTGDPAALAGAAAASGARYLYYSWYEARLRPEFLCLLDTTRTLPGLARVGVSAFPAAVLYRIGPGFGSAGWFDDPRQRAVSEARAAIWALTDSAAARGHALLAADAFLQGDARLARMHARAALALRPDETLARQVDSLARARPDGS